MSTLGIGAEGKQYRPLSVVMDAKETFHQMDRVAIAHEKMMDFGAKGIELLITKLGAKGIELLITKQ